MQKDIYERIISFLLGASWAIVFFGALFVFNSFHIIGFSLAIFFTILYVIVSLFMILVLDAFMVNKERLEEAKKQTEILEKIYLKDTK